MDPTTFGAVLGKAMQARPLTRLLPLPASSYPLALAAAGLHAAVVLLLIVVIVGTALLGCGFDLPPGPAPWATLLLRWLECPSWRSRPRLLHPTPVAVQTERMARGPAQQRQP